MNLDFSAIRGLVQNPSLDLVKAGWDRLHRLPGGKVLFSRAVGRFAPYSGSIPFLVEELGPGRARISLHESRRVQNHLQSIHAIALANLAELAGNLALLYAMPPGARFIVTELKMEYLQKARGRIEARCIAPIPSSNERRAYEIPVEIFDGQGTLVTRCQITSLVGPKKRASDGL